MDQQSKLVRAKQQVEAMTGFYIHAGVYALVNAGLLIINAATDPVWWVQWPILGWGIGLAAHGLAVFGRTPQFITNWQLRKIHQLNARK
jgi:hypothetical protein